MLRGKGNKLVSILDNKIEELDPTVRTYNVLKRAGINTIKDIVKMSWNDLSRVRGMGIRCLDEIEELLKKEGLKLRIERG